MKLNPVSYVALAVIILGAVLTPFLPDSKIIESSIISLTASGCIIFVGVALLLFSVRPTIFDRFMPGSLSYPPVATFDAATKALSELPRPSKGGPTNA